MKKEAFVRHEGAARFRAEQLMKAAAAINPATVPESGCAVPVQVGFDDQGKSVYETVKVIVRSCAGETYLMVA
ncbi:hypothetical protein IT412_05340 [Candidatus Peregrinibacteria bacterium]|nr:hypothetical protein [Candidatus Peregrinibacteria bacterium]